MSAPPKTVLVASPEEEAAIRDAVRVADLTLLGPTSVVAAAGHVAGLVALLADPAVSGPIYDLPRPITQASIGAWVAEAERLRAEGEALLTVSLDETGAVAGYSRFTVWPERSSAEIAGARRADKQNAGSGKAGAAGSFNWMFETLGVRLIGVTAALDNPRSARVIEAAGFKPMGRRDSVRPDGSLRPSRYWEMTRDAWRGLTTLGEGAATSPKQSARRPASEEANMSYQKIKVSNDGAVRVIALSDAATMNAAGVDMAAELHDAFKTAVDGPSPARAVLLTGEGRGFCSGANLSAGPATRAPDSDGRPDAGSALETVYNPLVTYMKELPIPIVTAVNGAAAGVGCSLALLGDLIVAAESAYFLQAFRRIGLVPDGGSTYMLPRLIGKARAMEMALLGERVSAAQALDWGLINRVVPDAELQSAAMTLAQALATGPASLGLTRQTLWASMDSEWAEQLHRERLAQKVAGKTSDFAEGVAAFLGKRPAVFQGK